MEVNATHVFRWPPASKRCHIFPSGNIRSLCGAWLYSGEDQDIKEVPISPTKEDCKECVKRFNKMFQSHGEQEAKK